jgi:hypothetical protein
MLLGSFYCMHCPLCPRVTESTEHLFATFPHVLELGTSLLPALSPFGCATAVAENFGGEPPAIGNGNAEYASDEVK